jgi:hypothetical protein
MISFACFQCKLGAKDPTCLFSDPDGGGREKYLPDWNARHAKPALPHQQVTDAGKEPLR